MRIEYNFQLDQVAVPRLSVEATEGIGKLFTLATLVLNVLDSRERVDLVFHGLNPDDPGRKIQAFRRVLEDSPADWELSWEPGTGGSVPGSSSHFQWISLVRRR
ncbi:MAG: hypothetical protein ABFS41_18015 [Myxococcota bacterium]